MAKADAAGCGGPKRHQAGKANTLFRDLADHDALQMRSLRVPEKVYRMFAIRIFLASRIVHDLLSACERADDTETVHPAGKAGNSNVLSRMHTSSRRVDDRKTLGLAVALLHQVNGLLHVDDVLALLRPEQQDIEIATVHFLLRFTK